MVPIRSLQTYLIGPGLGVAIVQRGRLVLHASAVRMDGRVLAFCGEAGCGKSTLAAALVGEGAELIGDDVLPVGVADEVTVGPGLPLVKLWPDAADMLSIPPNELAVLDPLTGKLRRDVHEGHIADPVELDAVVILSVPNAFSLQRLSRSEAMLALIGNSYAASALHPSGLSDEHFKSTSRLADRVPAWSLSLDRALPGRVGSTDALSRLLASMP